MNAPHSRPLNGTKMIMIRCLDGMLIKVPSVLTELFLFREGFARTASVLEMQMQASSLYAFVLGLGVAVGQQSGIGALQFVLLVSSFEKGIERANLEDVLAVLPML